jgi:hypothetical protein
VILMATDVCAMLAAAGQDEATLARLAEALEVPLERMMEGAYRRPGRSSTAGTDNAGAGKPHA